MTDEERDRDKTQEYWNHIGEKLKEYTQEKSISRRLGCKDQVGVFLIGACGVLGGLVAVQTELLGGYAEARAIVAMLAVYYIVDAMIVNTSITFVTKKPIHHLRSIVLSVLNVVSLGMAFAVVYGGERTCFNEMLTFIDAIYFSFVTLATLGYGDFRPDRACRWLAESTVVIQIVVSLYFLAVVLATVVAWANRRTEI